MQNQFNVMYRGIWQREGGALLEKSMCIYFIRESNYWSQSGDFGISRRWRKAELLQAKRKNLN